MPLFVDTVEWSPQTYIPIANTALNLNFSGLVFNEAFQADELKAQLQKTPVTSQVKDFHLPLPSTSLRKKLSDIFTLGLLNQSRVANSNEMLIMHRATVILSHPSELHVLNSIARSTSFDIIAVTPLNERIWQTLLTQGDFDVISLDLTSSVLQFNLRRRQLDQLVRRGILFEVSFGETLRNSSARINLFTNVQQLTQFLPHTHIFLSSRATHHLSLRSPADVAAIAQILGFHQKVSTEGMSANAMACLYKAAARRTAGGAIGLAGAF